MNAKTWFAWRPVYGFADFDSCENNNKDGGRWVWRETVFVWHRYVVGGGLGGPECLYGYVLRNK